MTHLMGYLHGSVIGTVALAIFCRMIFVLYKMRKQEVASTSKSKQTPEMLNSYDVLAWWGKVLNSCNTEDQFKNALNLWPKVIKLTPCIDDAWCEVVNAARQLKITRIVPPLVIVRRMSIFDTSIHNAALVKLYPSTKLEVKQAVFGLSRPTKSEVTPCLF